MNKKAIIIGASSGIGEGLARELQKAGYKTGITGRRKELLDKIKDVNPDSFIVKSFDITDFKASIDKINELVKELNGLDLLVISSGADSFNESLDFEIEKRIIDVNILGFTNIADWAYNYFKKQGQGHLAAISSIAGIRGNRLAPAYNATKAYQINYLEGLRQKSHKEKIKINITDVRPGFVDTDMAKGDGLFWVMPVDKAAAQIYGAIKSSKEVVYITKRWGFIAGLLKILPRFVYNKM